MMELCRFGLIDHVLGPVHSIRRGGGAFPILFTRSALLATIETVARGTDCDLPMIASSFVDLGLAGIKRGVAMF
jgi:hypothetical protein